MDTKNPSWEFQRIPLAQQPIRETYGKNRCWIDSINHLHSLRHSSEKNASIQGTYGSERNRLAYPQIWPFLVRRWCRKGNWQRFQSLRISWARGSEKICLKRCGIDRQINIFFQRLKIPDPKGGESRDQTQLKVSWQIHHFCDPHVPCNFPNHGRHGCSWSGCGIIFVRAVSPYIWGRWCGGQRVDKTSQAMTYLFVMIHLWI